MPVPEQLPPGPGLLPHGTTRLQAARYRVFASTPVNLRIVPYNEAMTLGLATGDQPGTVNPVTNYQNVFDRQRGVPRLTGTYFDRATPTFILSGEGEAWGGSGVDSGTLSIAGDARSDLIVDTARLNTPSKSLGLPPTTFLPSMIPVRGTDPFYGLGPRTAVIDGQGVGNIVAQATLNTPTLGPIIVNSELFFFTGSDGQPVAQMRYAWAQVRNLMVGKMDTLFADNDALPHTINWAGPNAEVYVQHGVIGYMIPLYIDDPNSPTEFVETRVGAEMPESSVTPYVSNSKDVANFNSRSRIPDFTGNLKWVNTSWGHLQAAVLLRDVGIENAMFTPTSSTSGVTLPAIAANHADVFGWGVHCTGVVFPFRGSRVLQLDYISAGGMWGDGIANYNMDLRALGSYDAFWLSPGGRLKALPLQSYWLAYTRVWGSHFRSTLVASEVDVDSFASPGLTASPYRQGKFVSANLIYQMKISGLVKPQSGTATPTTKTGNFFAGIEYLYGQHELLNGVTGVDHRVQLALGAKY